MWPADNEELLSGCEIFAIIGLSLLVPPVPPHSAPPPPPSKQSINWRIRRPRPRLAPKEEGTLCEALPWTLL